MTLPWRHNEHDSVSNHQPRECLLIRLIGADQRKHQSSASLAFVWGIHRRPVNSPHKGPVTRKMFPFDDVIMNSFKHFYLCETQVANTFWFSVKMTSWYGVSWETYVIANGASPCLTYNTQNSLGILTLEVPRDFPRSRRPFWMTSSDKNHDSQWNLQDW